MWYLTLRLVSPLNNPQNGEMKICEKYEVDMLKIILITSYSELFHYSYHKIIVDNEEKYNFKIKK
jgi:hypothetical protein